MNSLTLFAAALSAVLTPGAFAAQSATSPANSEPAAHRVVFELTSEARESWEAVLNNVENIRKALGAASVHAEVVVHGKGLGFLKTSNREFADRMRELAEAGVVFAACENTMKRQKVTKEQLLPFVQTVDSGVAEVVRKQEAGWSYVRVGG